jgi:hypothetical protein
MQPLSSPSCCSNTNFAIAAARLGLKTACIGHLVRKGRLGARLELLNLPWEYRIADGTDYCSIKPCIRLLCARGGVQGQDVFGRYMRDVLEAERIRTVEPVASSQLPPELDQTLLCFVMVDPAGRHAFCRCDVTGLLGLGAHEGAFCWSWSTEAMLLLGQPFPQASSVRFCALIPHACLCAQLPGCSRYDFGPWPLLSFVGELPEGVGRMLRSTEALFVNGFTFDELPAAAVLGAARTAREAGAAVFFDPGACPLAAADWLWCRGRPAQNLLRGSSCYGSNQAVLHAWRRLFPT